MSKRSKLNRRRVPFLAARSRRIAPTFPLILTGLLGLSSLSISSVSPTPLNSPILTGIFAGSRLYAQTPANSNATSPFRRPAHFAQPPQPAQSAANAPQNQVVFFSIPVAVDVAVVRSGPSEEAYPTGSVAKNRYVEAYFRSADGWCAIRPPQGSFSWVNAKFVRRETDGIGRIVASGGKAVPSRVGGATVEESALVQVGLKNGTQIKILDETRLSDGSTWLKIAPPSGEFRWIRANDLIADPAIAQLPTKLTFQREFLEQLARTPNAETNAAASASNALGVAPNSAPAPSSTAVSAAPANSPQTARLAPNAPTNQNAATAQTAQAASIVSTAASTSISEESATQFKMELARLNADVFQTLRQNPPSDAELALLASRAETLFDAAPTDGERFVVQSIYDAIKIAERRNRAQFGDGAFAPRVSPNSPNPPNPPQSSAFPGSSQSSELNGGNRFGEFQLEGDAPLLVLPDSSFEPSDDARSGAIWLDGSNGVPFPSTAPTADFNARADVAQFFPSSPTGRSPNAFDANADAQTAKRPRLAFAFSNANNPFRSRSPKGKEVQVAPVAPQTGGRAAGISKLPPLLPTQKQLIVPPPNYRSTPFGQKVRENGRLVAAKEASSRNASQATSEEKLKTSPTSQNGETAQELTVDAVRWRAVDKVADVSSPASAPVLTPDAASESSTKIASASATLSADDAQTGQASPIAATAARKAPAPTGATVPKIKRNADAPKPNKFQPISSRTSAAFDAAGVLARLPKAPKGAPQYVLTRPVGDDRFEVVSYLEAANGVSLEPYVGRNIGVKGTLGTIQIGENAQRLTTVQTVFEQN